MNFSIEKEKYKKIFLNFQIFIYKIGFFCGKM